LQIAILVTVITGGHVTSVPALSPCVRTAKKGKMATGRQIYLPAGRGANDAGLGAQGRARPTIACLRGSQTPTGEAGRHPPP